MPKLVVASVAIAVIVWIALSVAATDDNRLTADDVNETTRRALAGEPIGTGRPWYYERPYLAAIGAGLTVLVLGSVVVIAINTERRP